MSTYIIWLMKYDYVEVPLYLHVYMDINTHTHIYTYMSWNVPVEQYEHSVIGSFWEWQRLIPLCAWHKFSHSAKGFYFSVCLFDKQLWLVPNLAQLIAYLGWLKIS